MARQRFFPQLPIEEDEFDITGIPRAEPEPQIPQINYTQPPPNPYAVTDMDFDTTGIPPAEPVAPAPQPYQSPDLGSSVTDTWWQKYSRPKTDIGARTAAKINEQIPSEPIADWKNPSFTTPQDAEVDAMNQLAKVAVDMGGSMFDTMTAPIHAIPTIATLGQGLLAKGGLQALLSGIGRITSLGPMFEGSERMRNAESIPEWAGGALETVGGALGLRRPKVTPYRPDPIDPKTLSRTTRIGARPPKPTLAALPDYSPSSELVARKLLMDEGIPVSGQMSNIQIIDAAKTILQKTNPAQTIANAAPQIMTPAAKFIQPKVKNVGPNEWIPDDYPDVVLNSEGQVLRTLSGEPVRLPKAAERSIALEIANLPRAIQASMDLSMPLRQGLGLVHKGAWWRAWPDMFRSFGGDKAYKGVIDSIRTRPNFRPKTSMVPIRNAKGEITGQKFASDKLGLQLQPSFAEEAGLALTDNLTVREHEYMSKLAEEGLTEGGLGSKAWRTTGGRVIKASNRAYTAFANKLRADTFDALVDDFTTAGMDPRKNLELAKNIAGFVNAASGRGGLGDAERYAQLLNTGFFSPRLMSSRMQMMGKSAEAITNWQTYAMSGPAVRKEYLKSMLALGSAWSTMAGLSAGLTGAQVNLDSTNPDFMKIRYGDTRLDPAGGFQQWIVLANRMHKQKLTRSTEPDKPQKFNEAEGLYDPTMGETAVDFGLSKSAPLINYAWDLTHATKSEPFDTADRSLRLVVPIIAQDLAEILNATQQGKGDIREALTLPPEFFGMGAQTYSKDDMRRRMIPGRIGEGFSYPAPRQRSIFEQ